jgi:hypothetical protein
LWLRPLSGEYVVLYTVLACLDGGAAALLLWTRHKSWHDWFGRQTGKKSENGDKMNNFRMPAQKN